MNKSGLFFIALLFVNQASFAASPIVFQQATDDDVPQLLELYAGFKPDDADRLVVFPLEVRELFLNKAIKAGRVFVAKDTTKAGAPIVSFCKLFMVEAKDELLNIVKDELAALSAAMKASKPVKAVQLSCPVSFATDFKIVPVEAVDDVDDYVLNLSDTYVYYGGSYTHPDYRKNGICTSLERYALSVVQPAVVARLQALGGNLFYVYGVVQANYRGFARHRSFAQFAHAVGLKLGVQDGSTDAIELTFHAFNACKPTFYMDGPDLKLALEEKGRGYGCFLSCNMNAAG